MMKRIATVLLILIPILSYGEGIKFKELTISEIIETAKTENKYIFLIYGFNSCSIGMMSYTELKSDTTISEFMNSNLINVVLKDRLDDNEFDALFSIMDYPRYFFISPKGEIVMMRSNYHSPEKIKKYAQKILTGKTISPNLFMYTGKAYRKKKKTLSMLTHTMNAYLILQKNGFTLAKYSPDSELTLNQKELDLFNNEIISSFEYGEYRVNKMLRNLKISALN